MSTAFAPVPPQFKAAESTELGPDPLAGLSLPGRMIIVSATQALLRAMTEPSDEEKRAAQEREANERQKQIDQAHTTELKAMLINSPGLAEVHQFAEDVAKIPNPQDRAQLISEYLGRLAETEISKLKAGGVTPQEEKLISEIQAEKGKADAEINARLQQITLAKGSTIRVDQEQLLTSPISFGMPGTTFAPLSDICLTESTRALASALDPNVAILPEGASGIMTAQVTTPGLPLARFDKFPVRIPKDAKVCLA